MENEIREQYPCALGTGLFVDLFSAGRRQPVRLHVNGEMVASIYAMRSDNRTSKVINGLLKNVSL